MARRTNKKLAGELEGQSDPKAPLDWQRFLQAAQPVMKLLKADLAGRARGSSAVTAALTARHAADRADKRTADSFVEWLERFVEQVAAAWMLSCVFVRALEDRGLLGHNRLAGPGAADSLKLFLELAPSLNERDYLLTTFRELSRFSATRGLFDSRHNPVWLLTPSAEGAKALVGLFQSPHADLPAFRFGQADTAFLGWIYQDLDEGVRERFALLQTPRFVEAFILDRTLEPALERFGLSDTTLIDPTCGSGHFLLGAFERLFLRHLEAAPAHGPREAAKKALDAVHGADLNPYAVAIARFRLTLAFFEKAGYTRLSQAPAPPLHVVVADSLLHNPFVRQGDLADFAPSAKAWRGQEYNLEDEAAARAVLFKQYAAVVGNPPYITVKDATLRDRYRGLYPRSAAMNYSVAAPFTERFFQLARRGGRVGMITANSFMKREFGKKLIEQYLPSVNLDLVVNTSGAYIPGHGTPTVLLFGSHEDARGQDVMTVLASRGEPSTPADPEQGLVWRTIAGHWSETGFENEYISVVRTSRETLGKHPWSLGGGGAAELKELLEERAEKRLGDIVLSVGRVAHTGNDEAYVAPYDALKRRGLRDEHIAFFVEGQVLRDWSLGDATSTVFPYDGSDLRVCGDSLADPRIRWLWPFRAALWLRREPNGTHREIGKTWYEFSRFHPERFVGPGIAFAFVATHNHFVLDRGDKVFNRTAPIIKLPPTATEDDHLALLAYLNSSTACFWMKQVFQPKASSRYVGTENNHPEHLHYEFAGTGMERIPVPPTRTWAELAMLGRTLNRLSEAKADLEPSRILARTADPEMLGQRLREAKEADSLLRWRLIFLQEELDWAVYRAFGLSDVSRLLNYDGACEPEQRPYAGTAFPQEASEEYQNRASETRTKPDLRLLETPMFKRLWLGQKGVFAHNERTYDGQIRDACMAHLLGSVEAQCSSDKSANRLHDALTRISGDSLSRQLLSTVYPEEAAEATKTVREAVSSNAVPYLAALRFTASGLDKHAEWQHTWELQRREDAGETLDKIPVPPKYAQGDYRSTTTWQLRGPLDVPKERFISYPGCESDQDKEPVFGWAGWDHEQRAKALATLYWNRKTEESWSRDRLTPMLAGLLELLPWLKQWHDSPSDDYAGDSPANYYAGFLDGECRTFGLTHEDLRAWRPPEKTRGRKTATKTANVPTPSENTGDHPEAAARPEAKAGKKPRAKKTTTTGEAP